jgi:hypothetical protein
VWVPFPLVCLPSPSQEWSQQGFGIRQCLLDGPSLTECAKCEKKLVHVTTTGERQILCNLTNEGGLQQAIDILPFLKEEIYLRTFPEALKARAFLVYCQEGDVEAIVDLLHNASAEEHVVDETDDGDSGKKIDILRYQDYLGSMGTGLHAAIANGRVEVAWLLLFLASNLETSQFPDKILRLADQLGVQRDCQDGKVDIRDLENDEGLTPAHTARGVRGIWTEWLASGRLTNTRKLL